MGAGRRAAAQLVRRDDARRVDLYPGQGLGQQVHRHRVRDMRDFAARGRRHPCGLKRGFARQRVDGWGVLQLGPLQEHGVDDVEVETDHAWGHVTFAALAGTGPQPTNQALDRPRGEVAEGGHPVQGHPANDHLQQPAVRLQGGRRPALAAGGRVQRHRPQVLLGRAEQASVLRARDPCPLRQGQVPAQALVARRTSGNEDVEVPHVVAEAAARGHWGVQPSVGVGRWPTGPRQGKGQHHSIGGSGGSRSAMAKAAARKSVGNSGRMSRSMISSWGA